MATYNKFQDYTEQLNKGVHNWGTHTFKGLLSNVAPNAADTVLANLTDITPGNGYPAGGVTLDTVTLSESGGTSKVTVADEVLTASGAIGPFRYAPVYNDTPTSPADPLVCWWDYGSSISLANLETFTWDFDGTNGIWQLA